MLSESASRKLPAHMFTDEGIAFLVWV